MKRLFAAFMDWLREPDLLRNSRRENLRRLIGKVNED